MYKQYIITYCRSWRNSVRSKVPQPNQLDIYQTLCIMECELDEEEFKQMVYSFCTALGPLMPCVWISAIVLSILQSNLFLTIPLLSPTMVLLRLSNCSDFPFYLSENSYNIGIDFKDYTIIYLLYMFHLCGHFFCKFMLFKTKSSDVRLGSF